MQKIMGLPGLLCINQLGLGSLINEVTTLSIGSVKSLSLFWAVPFQSGLYSLR